MRLYLAGPMTSIPQFNFPCFDVWSQRLRDNGFEVISPHESDHPETQRLARLSEDGDPSCFPEGIGAEPVPTALKNVDDIGKCQGIALIPGWQKSSGVIHEIATAVRFRLPVAPVEMWCLIGPDIGEVIEA